MRHVALPATISILRRKSQRLQKGQPSMLASLVAQHDSDVRQRALLVAGRVDAGRLRRLRPARKRAIGLHLLNVLDCVAVWTITPRPRLMEAHNGIAGTGICDLMGDADIMSSTPRTAQRCPAIPLWASSAASEA